jgi:LPXTG-site transpeptidase (sortase) family protein
MIKKTMHHNKNSWFPILLILLGLLLMSLWATHRFLYNQSMSISEKLLASYAQEQSSGSLPIHISVGNINLPIVEAGRINGAWTISETSANHVYGSANPGSKGNVIIYAHNSEKLFGKLTDVKAGVRIAIRTTDSILHQYTVTSTEWVTTGHTELLAPTDTEILTLYTCAGLLDSLRVVVRAVPVNM